MLVNVDFLEENRLGILGSGLQRLGKCYSVPRGCYDQLTDIGQDNEKRRIE
jgi:hypothetical protein